MTTKEAIAWFKRTFGQRIAAKVDGTPFSVDLITAIANQETGYIWGPLVSKGMSEKDVLRLCVGDTLDEDRGRSCFPRTKADLLRAPRGAEMFAIARQALLEMASHTRGYENATINPNKFCHGFGIFQYDIQFFRDNPDYFLQKSWEDFDACLAQCIYELREAMTRQGWKNKTSLTDDEKVFVAIAYNKGTAKCSLGFQQGYRSDDGRCYGENIDEFLRIAQSIPLDGTPAARKPAVVPAAPARPAPVSQPAAVFKKIGTVFEVDVREGPLRLRSEPTIPGGDASANVIARLPAGHLVQRLSSKLTGDFMEVETTLNGADVRGFAASRFLRRVKRATKVRKSKTTAGQVGDGAFATPAVTRKTFLSELTEQKKTEGNMNIEAMIRAVQKEVGVGVDGHAGPETWQAIYLRVTGKKVVAGQAPKLPPAATQGVDARSEKTISTLQPEVRPYARALVLKAAAQGITIKVISGLRTYDEQNALYAQGRTKPGRIVTNARGGYSNHNFGIAFDIGIFDGSSYIEESPRYKAIGALGVDLGLEWGGNWKTIKDEPHFQLRPKWAADETEKDMLAELRSRAESGRGFYA